MQFKEGGGTEDGKAFVKLKDKESAMGIFRGDPYEFHQHWVGNKSELCKGSGCPLCAANPGKKPAFRFRLNFITKDPEGNYIPKVFEQGWNVYTSLRDLNKEYSLEQTIVKVTRNGSGMNDTSYTVLPAKNGAVTPDLESKLSQIKLLDLPHSTVEQPPHSAESNGPAGYTEEDIPF